MRMYLWIHCTQIFIRYQRREIDRDGMQTPMVFLQQPPRQSVAKNANLEIARSPEQLEDGAVTTKPFEVELIIEVSLAPARCRQ